jgi:TolB-like protein/DNA-binding winged helix-turn-helix (wHTH) protein/Tfp pilus assembly protein PilF
MYPSLPKTRVVRFGLFEADFEQRILTKGGLRVKLQDQPFQVLAMLLERPGELVTREEIQQRLWPGDTFVEFDDGLNTAIKKLRAALSDSADNPRFVETIPRRGYRYLGPITSQVFHPAEPAESKENVSEVLRADTGPALPHVTPGPKRSVRRRWLFAAIVTVVVSAIGLWRVEFRAQHHRSSQIHSLAVLPLRNLSGDPGQEYLADGITEELITDFAQSLPLRVISRTSVMRYKQTSQSITQIGQELGADAIVEGSVARSGNRLTVTIQLIDATEDRHLWAQRFDRNLGDLLSLEAELSQQIASQVGATLSSQRALAAAGTRPVDPQVHELCLMGRYHWNKRTAADLKKSVEYYQQAIARDPTYAPAYAGLADSYALMPSYDSVLMKDSYAKAADAAHHALQLDDSLAQAHTTLGFLGLNSRTGWTQAGPEFRRALDLNPNYATAHHWFAFYLVFFGRWNEALAEIEIAQQLDPVSAIIRADEGHFLYAMRRYDEAKVRLRQAIDLTPDLGQPHETLALIYLETGQTQDAFGEARTGLALDPDNPRTIAEAGYVLAVTGHKDQARELLARLNKLVLHGASTPLYAAFIYTGLGQRSRALDALEEASVCCVFQGTDQWHILDGLQDDPRYQRLMAKSQEMRTAQPSSKSSAP